LSETKTLNNNTPVDTICIIGVPPHLWIIKLFFPIRV
jgi:hypothetical protein